MLSRIKTYLTLISLIIAIIAGGYGLFSKMRADRLAIEKANLEDELNVKTTEVVRYKNKLGQEVVKTIEYTKSIKQLKVQMKIDSTKLTETERDLTRMYNTLDIKDKQLKSMTKIDGKGYGSGVFDTVYVAKEDSIGFMPTIKVYDDGWLNAIITEDSLNYVYKINIDVFSASRAIDRKFFLWRWIGWKKIIDKDMVEVVSKNPHTVFDVTKIKIKK